MKSRASKLVFALAAVMALFYLGYQVMLIFYSPYRTETAAIYKLSDEIKAQGIAVRDEQTLSDTSDGAFVFLISDGERIAKNAVIAKLYPGGDELSALSLLQKYEQERELLIKLNNLSVETVDTDVNRQLLFAALTELSQAASDNGLSDFSNAEAELTERLGTYCIQTKQNVSYSDRISRLNELIDELSAIVGKPTSYLYAPETGYFVTSTDGFEALVSTKTLSTMSVTEVCALLETTPNYSANVKMVLSYKWQYAAVVDSRYAARFSVGARLWLDFSYAGVTDIPAEVVSVTTDEELGKTLVVFECDYFNSATASLRLDSAYISFRNYSGIKVDRSSLRMEDGVLGVYVKYGNEVKFKSVNIVFETEDYILSEGITSSSTQLCLYDEVITSGRDLYVGKQLS